VTELESRLRESDERLIDATGRAASDTRLLQGIAADLSAAVTVEDVQRVAVRSARDAVDADAVLIGSVDRRHDRLVYHGFDTYPSAVVPMLPTSLEPGSSPAADTVVTRKTLVYRTSEEILRAYPSLEPLLSSLEYESRIFVPIVGSADIVGMMVASSRQPARFGEADARLLDAVARQCGQSMERAAFYRDARRSAERSAGLQAATFALTEAPPDEVPGAIIEAGMDLAGASRGGLALVDRETGAMRASGRSGIADEVVERWAEVPIVDVAGSPRVVRSGRAVLLDGEALADVDAALAADARGLGLGSITLLRLTSGARLHGVLALGFAPDVELDADDLALLDAFAERATASLHRADLQESETATRRELHGALSRLSRLQAVTTALGRAVRNQEVAAIVLEATTEALGGIGGSVYEGEGDVLRLLEARGITGRQPWRGLETVPASAAMAMCEAYRTGHVVWVPSKDEWRHRYPRGEELFRGWAGSTIGIPFPLEHRVLGCMTILFEREHALSRNERRLARTIGEQAAQAFERARLYDLEVRRAEHTERLQRLSAELAASATPDDIAHVLTTLGAEVVGAHASIVALVDDDRDEVEIVSASGFPPGLLDRIRLTSLDDRRPGNDVIRSGRASFLGTPDEISAAYPNLDPRGPVIEEAAWATLPLRVAGVSIGCVHYSFPEPRTFSAAERAELHAMANEAALAMDRARMFAREREASLVLQDSLLPRETLSSWRGSDVVARYWAGARYLDVGGDWYDVIPLPGGRLGVSIGDVVGRGLKAAAAMGQLRSALRSLALDGRGPVATIEALDRFATSTPGTELATVVYAELDPETRELRYASAGHPPPVALVEGRARVLEGGRSPLLAAGFDGPREEAAVVLPIGSTVVAYTDGLVERRGEPIDVGIARLVACLEAGDEPDLDDLSDRIATDLLEEDERRDDVAFLCLRVGMVTDALSMRIPSDPYSLRNLRRSLDGWLVTQALDRAQVESVVLAVNEAVSNSIEHGYRDGSSGEIGIEAVRHDDLLAITVRDRGTWRPGPPDPARGRGLAMMRALMDDVGVHHDDGGTTVRLSVRLEPDGGPAETPRDGGDLPARIESP
jgi:GAF domain-containing protein/anti-sigma regulatory factor (Ser/Thr protein kinase)